ncbi:polysaccharide biosynthesis protein [Ferruginibacter sp. HRS2-29]|nr:polysaccharide biosynthesis protein [Ferruginibacter sp. HRS2-29]
MWYGGSTIAAKLINLLLTPFLTYTLANTSDYGKNGLVYALIPIFNIIFTYGFETAYFRFSGNKEGSTKLYSTASLSLFFSTILFTIILWFNKDLLGKSIGLEEYPGIIKLMILIIATDTLAAIPFARLRQEGRPRKFAAAKVLGIIVNVILTWFFIGYCPSHYAADHSGWVSLVYDPKLNPITYVLLANLIQSIITLLFLFREIMQVRFEFDTELWKKMMIYALPLILVGMGGMINETMDRLMIRWWLPGTEKFREEQVGIYNACYKLSILITLFIQAFKMSAEPFFFKQAEGVNPQKVYARVMKFFVIIISVMFLVVSLFVPVWKYFIGPKYWGGLGVVPVLLMANIFLGIYYNLSVWYKLSNKTIYGAWVTLLGAGITILINYFFIPEYGFVACSWATFLCYGTMMVVSFTWGQKHYRIPYAWKKLVAYLVIVGILFFIHKGLISIYPNTYFHFATGALLLFLYCRFLGLVEHKEFAKLPYVGKYFIRKK